MNIRKVKIDVRTNEKEVLEYLHSKGIFERGNILSPKKELWFKYHHYLKFIDVPVDNRPTFHWLCYVYTTDNDKYEGDVLEIITLNQMKEYLNGIKNYKNYKTNEKD